MKSAVLVFPGINRERDMARTIRLVSGSEPAMVWHAEHELPVGTDLVVVPGGFSYGDYLRCGAIAARAPIMDAVRAHARARRPGARRLQRLSDHLRGRTAARRADAKRPAQVRLQGRLPEGRALRHAVHPWLQCRSGDPRPGGATAKATTRPTPRPSRGWKARARVAFRYTAPTASSIRVGT